MIGLIQRVSEASVTVEGETIARIGKGLLVLVGVQRNDGDEQAQKLADKILKYRVFSDQQGKMNLSVQATAGGILVVPQFTLPADTAKGLRPSFTPAASPDQGKLLFETLFKLLQTQHIDVQCGRFGADMQVALINDGPVTFWLQVDPD